MSWRVSCRNSRTGITIFAARETGYAKHFILWLKSRWIMISWIQLKFGVTKQWKIQKRGLGIDQFYITDPFFCLLRFLKIKSVTMTRIGTKRNYMMFHSLIMSIEEIKKQWNG